MGEKIERACEKYAPESIQECKSEMYEWEKRKDSSIVQFCREEETIRIKMIQQQQQQQQKMSFKNKLRHYNHQPLRQQQQQQQEQQQQQDQQQQQFQHQWVNRSTKNVCLKDICVKLR